MNKLKNGEYLGYIPVLSLLSFLKFINLIMITYFHIFTLSCHYINGTKHIFLWWGEGWTFDFISCRLNTSQHLLGQNITEICWVFPGSSTPSIPLLSDPPITLKGTPEGCVNLNNPSSRASFFSVKLKSHFRGLSLLLTRIVPWKIKIKLNKKSFRT